MLADDRGHPYTMKTMKFLSVCSGIEAASVAWKPLGWEASGFAEIEPFPCAVLAHHYPDVPNHGDMSLLPSKIRNGEVEAPDLLCGGTPCQAFSVAGLRQSLDDARGNLTLTFCEIADAIDSKREQPCIVFWENVPGVLNTKDNAFGCFLGALAGEDDALVAPGGRWANAGFIDGPQRAVAWRVLDAQYFGVAQRRRRVFVIASARADFDPAAVLFEFEGVRRDTAPSRETGQKVAGTFTARANSGGWGSDVDLAASEYMQPYQVANCLTQRMHKGMNSDCNEGQTPVLAPIALAENTIGRQPHNGGNGDGFTEGGPMYTLNATGVHGVAQPIPFGVSEQPDVGHCLRSGASKADKHESTTYVAQPVAAFKYTMGAKAHGIGYAEEQSPTFDTKPDSIAVMAPTLTATNDPSRSPQSTEVTNQVAAVHAASMAVRRLTPVECERLQGFPDNYTNIPWRKATKSPDGPRYKALGNSWAVPVVRWIGERIERSLA
jgi:DNA (cytosine-5)-methyltransferase 1